MALRVETVRGAGKLPEQDRTEVETAVGDVLSQYVVGAFLGDFPREEFVGSFESFTSGVARSAAGDIDLLTAARVQDAESVRATQLDARLSFLVSDGDVVGATAAVDFGFEATMGDGETRPLPGRPVHAPGEGRHLVDLRLRRRPRRRRALGSEESS